MAGFIGPSQLQAIGNACRGEERQHFIDLLCTFGERIVNMPKTYEQEGKDEQAVIYLHYFTRSCDWYITERDMEAEQLQAFGLANLGYGAELGYISIKELLESGAELDLYFRPRPIAQLAEVAVKPYAQTAVILDDIRGSVEARKLAARTTPQ